MFMLGLALLPAAILLKFIYSADKRDKEPKSLLFKLFLFGVLSTFVAAFMETVLGEVLEVFFEPESLTYMAIENFLIVALFEELGKYLVVKKLTWKHPAFNYTFDAVVYAVFASLGFAAFENIIYLMDGTVGLAVVRGVLSVPGHAIDAVFMGYYFGLAKRCEVMGDNRGVNRNLRRALWIPVLMHGFYDFCLSTEIDEMLLAFLIYEIVITILAIRKVKKLSAQDIALFPGGYPGATYAQQMYSQGILKFDPRTGQSYYVDPSKMNYDPITGEYLH